MAKKKTTKKKKVTAKGAKVAKKKKKVTAKGAKVAKKKKKKKRVTAKGAEVAKKKKVTAKGAKVAKKSATKKPQAKKGGLPEVGDVYCFPLERGRWGACRVLQYKEEHHGYEEIVLVELSAWIGDVALVEVDQSLRKPLKMTHHNWKGVPYRSWARKPVPGDWILVGTLAPRAKDRQVECNTFGGWPHYPRQRHLQWRWNHERREVLAEDEAKEAAKRSAKERAEAERVPPTLVELAGKVRLRAWEGFVKLKLLRGSHQILARTIGDLRTLGPSPSREQAFEVIQRGVEAFNALDAKEGPFIDTQMREDLAGQFNRMAEACGHPVPDVTEAWRDW